MTTPDKGLVTAAQIGKIIVESNSFTWDSLAEKLNALLAPLIELEVAKAVWREHQIACPECRRIANGMPWTCERRAELKHLAGEQTT